MVGRKNDDIATFYTANVKFVPSRHSSSEAEINKS